MKKYLVLFLAMTTMLSLGCGGGGGGGGGSAATITTNKLAINQEVQIPGALISTSTASLRGSVNINNVMLRLTNGSKSIDLAPTRWSGPDGNNNYILYFLYTDLSKADLGLNASDTITTLPEDALLLLGGQDVAKISIKVNDQGSESSGNPNVPVTFRITITLNGSKIVVTGGKPGSIDDPDAGLLIEDVKYKNGQGTWQSLASNTTDVPLIASFALHFNNPVANATESWSLTVSNLTTGSSFTLESGPDDKFFIVNQNDTATSSIIFITVVGDAGTRKLSANTRYRVNLNSSTLVKKGSNTKLSAFSRTFKTVAQ